jgi:uncharacterized protein YjbI with pentapeptide repeats
MLEAWKKEQDQGNRPGPFATFKLTGADVYWLAALVAGAGDVGVGRRKLVTPLTEDLSTLHLEGANLARAHLEGAILVGAQLKGTNLALAQLEGVDLIRAQLEVTDLREAQLKGADLSYAKLKGAFLGWAHLEGTTLREAQLEGTTLRNAYLEGAILVGAQLKAVSLVGANLSGVNLRDATLDGDTKLVEILLDSAIRVADVTWNGVSLLRLRWEQVPRLGDEAAARQDQTSELKEAIGREVRFEVAARAYRQLAIALRGQGITDAADRFTYRALIIQRKALWWQLRNKQFGALGAYLFSLFLAVLTGYGFRMWRIVAAYL